MCSSSLICLFARGNSGLSGESMIAFLMDLLVHQKFLNWLVLNSPTDYGTKDYTGLTYTEVLTVLLKSRRTECDMMR